MASEARRGDALQLIFSIFVGVLTAVVVGVGVWTFYPPPFGENSEKQQRIEELYRQQSEVDGFDKGASGDLSAEEKAKSQKIQKEINDLQREISREQKGWAVTTSIIVIGIATVLMAISLFLPEVAKVFSNGILLGGLFTVLYGTGVSFTGGDSRARFYVVLAALVLSLAIGYLRFIRGRMVAAAVVASGEAAAVSDADLAARVAALEAKFAALTSAFGGRTD